ncbi:MAG: GNAT family N-acetyltransferase [Ilumatobacteraceae bacterium]
MAFTPISTPRLLLRPVRQSDAHHLAARRSDPDVARYQNWLTPYPLERAEAMIAELMALEGPTDDEWWMLTVADPSDSEVFGDLVVHLTQEGRTAEIGYTLARRVWGHGYAVEGAAALVEYLFETVGVTRVEAMLHPDNPASAMVLERAGLLFEGHTRSSFWLGDDNSDDWLYGMTRPDWDTWRNRPRHRPEHVELVEVTRDNLDAVLALATHRSQQRFVEPVANSLAEALVPPAAQGETIRPWCRAVLADGEPVGFVMVGRSPSGDQAPYLWRLLVDRLHQRRGIGGAVIGLVADQCRTWGAAELLASWMPAKGSPEPFLVSCGFVPIGTGDDGEVDAHRVLTSAPLRRGSGSS